MACGKVDPPQQQSGQISDQDGQYFMLCLSCFRHKKQNQPAGVQLLKICTMVLHSKVCIEFVGYLIDPGLNGLQLAFGPWVLLSLAAALQLAVWLDANGRYSNVSFSEHCPHVAKSSTLVTQLTQALRSYSLKFCIVSSSPCIISHCHTWRKLLIQ